MSSLWELKILGKMNILVFLQASILIRRQPKTIPYSCLQAPVGPETPRTKFGNFAVANATTSSQLRYIVFSLWNSSAQASDNESSRSWDKDTTPT